MRGVERYPVALPPAEQLGPHRLDERMLDLQPFARLFTRHLGDVGRVHGRPAVVLQEDLGAAVLRLADVGASRPERLVAEGRWRQADAVDVTSGYADGPDEADEQRVDVAALPAEVSRLQHGLDVADATAAHLGIPVGVGEDPVVYRPHLLDIGGAPLDDLERRLTDDAVSRHEISRFCPQLQGLRILRGRDLFRPVERPIQGLEAARQFDHRGALAAGELGVEHAGAVGAIGRRLHHLRVPRPLVVERLLVVRLDRGYGKPGPDHARRLQDLDARRDLERSPRAGTRRELLLLGSRRQCETRHLGRRGDRGQGGRGPQERASVHGVLLVWMLGQAVHAMTTAAGRSFNGN